MLHAFRQSIFMRQTKETYLKQHSFVFVVTSTDWAYGEATVKHGDVAYRIYIVLLYGCHRLGDRFRTMHGLIVLIIQVDQIRYSPRHIPHTEPKLSKLLNVTEQPGQKRNRLGSRFKPPFFDKFGGEICFHW